MTESMVHTVAVVGTGVIGRSWAQLFARKGCETRLYDRDPEQLAKAVEWIEEDLEHRTAAGEFAADVVAALRSRISLHDSLDQALQGAHYVQESGPEQLDVKQALYRELDAAAAPATILGSSTSALDMTAIAEGLEGARRCIVAHPVNPPHVIPVVEIVPGKETTDDVLRRTCTFMRRIGQTPVVLSEYVPGFLLNRMQAALLREAMSLVQRGVADVAAVDAVIRDGLGLRWALMGPFGVGDTNADGGVRDYFTGYREAYLALMDDLGETPDIDDEFVERLGAETDLMQGRATRAEVLAWRDRMVEKILRLKQEDPNPGRK
jgi:3-hydroxyacyl-CoA dehydrogenase